MIVSRRLTASRWPLRIFSASAASIEAMTSDDRRDDAGRVAGGRRAGRRGFGHQAGEAGRFAGQNRHRLPFGADAAAVDPRLAVFHGEIVEQEPRGEVVGAVDDHVHVAGQLRDVEVRDIGNDRLDFDFGIDAAQFVGGGDGLGQPVGHVLLVVQHLALQVVELDEVAIDDPHEADAGANERFSHHRAQRPATAHQRPGRRQPPLPFFAQRREAGLAIVTRWCGLRSCSIHPVPGAKSTGRRGASRSQADRSMILGDDLFALHRFHFDPVQMRHLGRPQARIGHDRLGHARLLRS